MFKQKTIRILVIGLALLLMLSAIGNVLAQDEIEAVTISSSEDGLVVPESIPAGWVELSFENSTEIPMFTIIGRLDDGATMDDFMAAMMGMMGGDMSIIPPASFIGSPTALPESTSSAIYNLEAGNYVLINLAGEEPDIAAFVVEGEAAESDLELEVDLTVTLVDFAFGLPEEVPAGEQIWHIENAGEQWHEMAVIPVPDGTTLEDAMMMLMGGEEGAEAAEEGEGGGPEFAMVWAPMSPEQEAWLHVDLAPGTYLITCFIEDSSSEEHEIHAALGMIQILTIVEAEA